VPEPDKSVVTDSPVTGDGEPVHVFLHVFSMASSFRVQLPVSQVQSLCALQVSASVLYEQAKVIFINSARDTSVISVSMVAFVGNDVKPASASVYAADNCASA